MNANGGNPLILSRFRADPLALLWLLGLGIVSASCSRSRPEYPGNPGTSELSLTPVTSSKNQEEVRCTPTPTPLNSNSTKSEELNPNFASLKEEQIRLRMFCCGNENSSESIPLAAQIGIRRSKDLAQSIVNDWLDEGIGLSEMQGRLAALAADYKRPVDEEMSEFTDEPVGVSCGYGEMDFKILDLNSKGSRRGLVFSQGGAYCGNDQLFVMFKKNESGWSPELTYETQDPKKPSEGVCQAKRYFLSDPEDDSKPSVIIFLHPTCWCTSNWNGFRMSIVSSTPSGSRVLFSEHFSAFEGENASVGISGTSVVLHYDGWAGGGQIVGSYERKYELQSAEKFVLVGATNPVTVD